jgi:hypothetical protein
MTPQSLAILVTTSRHPDYVVQLAGAARQKGKAVRVHFAGQGVRLADETMLSALAGEAEVSVCAESAREHRWPGGGMACTAVLGPASRMAELIRSSDRYVVF